MSRLGGVYVGSILVFSAFHRASFNLAATDTGFERPRSAITRTHCGSIFEALRIGRGTQS
jgi:hypothetical protein